MKILPISLAIALAGAACGSSSKPAGDPLPVDGIVDADNTAACDALVRCHLFSDTAFCPLYFGQTQTGFNTLSAGVAGVKAGRIHYDAAAARACIDALAAISCSALAAGNGPAPEACKQVFTGTVADGQPCVSDAECLTGGFCAAS